MSSDCPIEVPCVVSAYSEVVWWDDRTDAAVNDLATIALAQDDTNLYIVVEQWIASGRGSIGCIRFIACGTRR